MAKLKYIHNI